MLVVSLISLEILIDIVFVVNIHAGYIESVIMTDDVDASLQSFTSATICSCEYTMINKPLGLLISSGDTRSHIS